ncbi:MAG: metal ABC transporter permease [Planctomycetes bacterium]|nr:metal ABC transporter permease [Planctomycetota bacterium]
METLSLLWSMMAEGILISFASAIFLPLIGGLLYLRRQAFLGVAVPQFSAAGIAAGLALLPNFPSLQQNFLDHGHPPLSYLFLFAGGAAGLALLIFAWIEKRSRHASVEGHMAAGFALAGAASLIFLEWSPSGGTLVDTLQRGSVVVADHHALSIVLAIFGLVALLQWRYWRGLLLVSFDRDAAHVQGFSSATYDLLFHIMAGSAIGIGVMTLGPVLVFGLLFLGPWMSRPLANSMRQFFALIVINSLLATGLAWPISFHLDLPYGPVTVALLAVLAAVASVAFKLRPRRG